MTFRSAMTCVVLAGPPALAAEPPIPAVPPPGFHETAASVIATGGGFTVTRPPELRAYVGDGTDREHGVVMPLPSGGVIAVARLVGEAEFGEDVPCAKPSGSDAERLSRGTVKLAGHPACMLTIDGRAQTRIIVQQSVDGAPRGTLFSLFLITGRASRAEDERQFRAVLQGFKLTAGSTR